QVQAEDVVVTHGASLRTLPEGIFIVRLLVGGLVRILFLLLRESLLEYVLALKPATGPGVRQRRTLAATIFSGRFHDAVHSGFLLVRPRTQAPRARGLIPPGRVWNPLRNDPGSRTGRKGPVRARSRHVEQGERAIRRGRIRNSSPGC